MGHGISGDYSLLLSECFWFSPNPSLALGRQGCLAPWCVSCTILQRAGQWVEGSDRAWISPSPLARHLSHVLGGTCFGSLGSKTT